MIQRLRLENWRAYDRLDIELGPGATFVVASNGIGKTSLIMAAAWGMFGDIAGVKGRDELRGDAEAATVTVDLRLPTSGALEIIRSVDRRGRSEVTATLGDRTIDSQEELEALFFDEFGADARVLAQLTFMIHGGLHETQGEFELRDHLAGLFGATPLLEGAARAEALAKESARTIRQTKVVERSDDRQKDELIADGDSAEEELRVLQEQRERAVASLNEASERLRAAKEWTAYRTALDERAAKLSAYAEAAGALFDREIDADDLLDVLGELEAEERRALSELETRAATARGRADVIRESSTSLASAEGVCPTCLRPLAEHEADRATEEHAQHLESLEATIAEAEKETRTHRAVLENLTRILDDIRSVPTPVEPSSDEPSDEPDAVQETHDAARDEVQRLDQLVAERSTSLKTIRDAIEAIEQDREQMELMEELYRTEGLALAAAQTFQQTADRIMERHIEPLVAEVAQRWKKTFGRGGLQLGTDGRITRQVGSRTLDFRALSGGERVWALLVARLLVASTCTQAPFVWLDEPLEHLDPRLRRIVAGTLAMASSRSGIRQIVVTTYEAPIAQQLMEDVPSASLVYVSSTD